MLINPPSPLPLLLLTGHFSTGSHHPRFVYLIRLWTYDDSQAQYTYMLVHTHMYVNDIFLFRVCIMCECLWRFYYPCHVCKEDYRFAYSDIVSDLCAKKHSNAVLFDSTNCHKMEQYQCAWFLENAVYRFDSFQLGQVVWGPADTSITSGVICTADGLPFPTDFPCTCSLAEVRLLACYFQPPCRRFSLGAASIEATWHETQQNETGSKSNSTTLKNGNKRHSFTKQNQAFFGNFFDVYSRFVSAF